MKIIIIINLILALFFLLASLNFLKKEILNNKFNSNKSDSKNFLINYNFLKMISCSIASLVFFSNNLYLGILGQAFFISTGIESFSSIIKIKFLTNNIKILLVLILSVSIAYLSI